MSLGTRVCTLPRVSHVVIEQGVNRKENLIQGEEVSMIQRPTTSYNWNRTHVNWASRPNTMTRSRMVHTKRLSGVSVWPPSISSQCFKSNFSPLIPKLVQSSHKFQFKPRDSRLVIQEGKDFLPSESESEIRIGTIRERSPIKIETHREIRFSRSNVTDSDITANDLFRDRLKRLYIPMIKHEAILFRVSITSTLNACTLFDRYIQRVLIHRDQAKSPGRSDAVAIETWRSRGQWDR